MSHEQIALRRQLGDPIRLGAALNNLGNLMFDIGDHSGAVPVLEEAIEKFHESGESASLMLSSLGGGALWVGNYDDAERRYGEALHEARVAEDAYAIAVAMGGLGQCFASVGRLDEARSQLVEARERFEELNVTPGVADADLYLALVEREVGSLAESARRLHMALNAPGENWYDEADYWVAQTTASIIDDHSTAAMLIGAATVRYERSNVSQSVDDSGGARFGSG